MKTTDTNIQGKIGMVVETKTQATDFSINGYWKEDNEPFEGYIVRSTDFNDDVDDEDIFFYGLSEQDIKDAIENGNDDLEFVITSYEL